MARVDFYHLTRWPLDRALPPLLQKVLENGHRAVVLVATAGRVAELDNVLWTFDDAAWLPHGPADGPHPADQPILLTDAVIDVPNRADVLVRADGADGYEVARFSRTLDLFDGTDPAAVEAARARYRAARDAGHTLVYWQQAAAGGWQQAHSTASGG